MTNYILNDAEFQVAWRKFNNGDGVSDTELAGLIERIAPAERTLSLLGLEYNLAWHPLWTRLDRMRSYQEARIDARE